MNPLSKFAKIVRGNTDGELMKFIVLVLIFIAASVGFIHNYRQEAQEDWQAFEVKFNKPVSKLMVQKPLEEPTLNIQATPATQSETAISEDMSETAYVPTERDPLSFLSSELTSHPLFVEITDFNLDELDMMENKEIDHHALRELTGSVIQQLTACIANSSCLEELGQKYSDIGEMRSVQLLERSLYIALALQDHDPSVLSVNASMISDILKIPNAPLHYVALEILGAQKLEDQDFSTLLALSIELPMESKGHLFSRLEREAQTAPGRREAYLKTMGAEITKNSETALEILKHLPFIDLNAQELTTLSKSLCHYGAADVDKKEQWDMIQFHHGQYNELKGHGVKLHHLCGQ